MTVLFCDVTGSTALGEQLDPESLRTLLARYFDQMKAIVERHGGTVEKFIGDAVMAVFGVPVVHEDDALRALRAAHEMREAFPELGVQGRIGVMTGEVVAGTEERLATGDAVNVASRLQSAAEPGDVLLGAETYGLARDAVDVEPIDALALKGKSQPVAAYRLLGVREGEGFARRLDAAWLDVTKLVVFTAVLLPLSIYLMHRALDYGRRLADMLPQGRFEVVADSYTFMSEDQPARLAELIRTFLKERFAERISERVGTEARGANPHAHDS